MNTGKVVEACSLVVGDHCACSGQGSCRDDQIVGPSGPADPAYMGEQPRMSPSDVHGVLLDRNRGEDGVDKRLAGKPIGVVGQFDALEQLRGRDGSDHRVVIVLEYMVEDDFPALYRDQYAGVQDQSFHGSSRVSRSRVAITSPSKASSRVST